jgi:hypothetical protein
LLLLPQRVTAECDDGPTCDIMSAQFGVSIGATGGAHHVAYLRGCWHGGGAEKATPGGERAGKERLGAMPTSLEESAKMK